MPQIIFEYSASIKDLPDWDRFFKKIHLLVHRETGIDPESCKSRALRLEPFYVGEGTKYSGFVHLEVALLSGRTINMKQLLGNALLELLKAEFSKETAGNKVQLTVEIRDIQRQAYFKHPPGTLTPLK